MNKSITHTIKRLITWLFDRPDVAVVVRPTHRDIQLNSSAAISIYLDSIDRPTHSDVTRTHEDGGGTSLDELE